MRKEIMKEIFYGSLVVFGIAFLFYHLIWLGYVIS